MNKKFHGTLKEQIHRFVVDIYKATENFPKQERYSSTSQLRRATLSVMLNYVEGFARFKIKVQRQFYETSYGSARESKYIIYLAKELESITEQEYKNLFTQIDDICKMLYKVRQGVDRKISD